MWPTSTATWKRSVPPQFGQVSPSLGSRRSAKRGWKSRPASTPRRWKPSRFAPATNCPLRRASSAITSPPKPIGPSEPPPAPNAARISSSVAGRESPGIASKSFMSLSRSSPRTSASTTVPSGFLTGIAFDVAVERVRVLHDELADAEQPSPRARLVAVLDREVVPELRQLLVRLDLACVERDRLLMRRRHDVRASLDAEGEVGGIHAAGRLPKLDGR